MLVHWQQAIGQPSVQVACLCFFFNSINSFQQQFEAVKFLQRDVLIALAVVWWWARACVFVGNEISSRSLEDDFWCANDTWWGKYTNVKINPMTLLVLSYKMGVLLAYYLAHGVSVGHILLSGISKRHTCCVCLVAVQPAPLRGTSYGTTYFTF